MISCDIQKREKTMKKLFILLFLIMTAENSEIFKHLTNSFESNNSKNKFQCISFNELNQI